MSAGGRTATPELDRLLAGGPALESTDWSLAPTALELVLRRIRDDCEQVIECGSGLSTILIARLLAERREGTVHALEHDPDWAAVTRRRIADEGLGAHARVVDAPLGPDPLAEPGCEWYDRAALAELPRAGVGLLLVDGPPAPPGSDRERSRYAALPLLASRLAPGATVILDDAHRPGEAWALRRWESEFGIRFERDSGERIAIGCMFPPRAREGPGATCTERME